MKWIVEHQDGRRVSVDEADFDRTEGNPYNQPRTVVAFDGGDASGNQTLTNVPGRLPDDHVSLKAEGFKPTHAVDPETGHEMPLDAKQCCEGTCRP